MAGKRHHILPRLLQKGFASHVVGKQVYTWWHRKSQEPINVNLRNVGVQGRFYSVTDEPHLDDSMTQFEIEIEPTITALRGGPARDLADPMPLAKYIAHLELRTFHLRQSMMSVGTIGVKLLLNFIDDEVAFAKWMRRRLAKDPSILTDLIAAQARAAGLAAPDPATIMRSLEPHLDQALGAIWPGFRNHLNAIRSEISDMMRGASKTAQLKALTHALAPPSKVDIYDKLSFRLIDTVTPLILADAGLLFQVADQNPFRSFFSRDYPLVAVLLPLSTNRLLVGSALDYLPNLERLPLEIARSSFDYFIASEASDRNAQLVSEIGQNTDLLSEREMGTIIEEIMSQ